MKIKCVGRQEFVIGGWTDPQRSRVGLGALLVGYYEGDRLRYAGKVGTGYTREVLLDLRQPVRRAGPEGQPLRRRASRRSARPSTGSSPSWWPRSPSPSGRRTACSASRGTRGSGPTRRPASAAASGPPRPRPSADAAPTRPGDTAMPLEEYNAKRDFTKTREPSGAEEGEAAQAADLRRAGAPRLGPALRLPARGRRRAQELVGPQGAVARPVGEAAGRPGRGPPARLRDLRGRRSPQGQYGGGTVAIWDHGTYESLMDEKAEPQTAAEAIEAGRHRVRHARRAAQGEVRPDPHEAPGQGQAAVAAHEAEGRVRRGRERRDRRSPRRSPRPPPKATPRPAPAGTARPRRRSS